MGNETETSFLKGRQESESIDEKEIQNENKNEKAKGRGRSSHLDSDMPRHTNGVLPPFTNATTTTPTDTPCFSVPKLPWKRKKKIARSDNNNKNNSNKNINNSINKSH